MAFHDLNVNIPPSTDVIQTLEKLGYATAAFATCVIPPSGKLGANSIPAPPPLPNQQGSSSAQVLHSNAALRSRQLRVLRRVTLFIDDASHLPLLQSSVLAQYDLVAVYVTTEKMLQMTLQFDFDILQCAVEKKNMFHIKRPHVHVAQQKVCHDCFVISTEIESCSLLTSRASGNTEQGIHFEICYGPALRDTNSRRNTFSNAASLTRATNGKQIVLSSGARNVIELRGARDMINLGILFGMPQEEAHNAATRCASDAVAHGDIRARTHKGIVRITKVDRKDPKTEEKQMQEKTGRDKMDQT